MPNPSASKPPAAAEIISRWLQQGDFPARQLERSRNAGDVRRDVDGVVRHLSSLQYVLKSCCKKSPSRKLQGVLLVGINQLLYRPGRPDHAVVNECVATARTLCSKGEAGFVNAVLRRVAREQEAWRSALATSDDPEIRWNHPRLLLDRWQAAWGAEGVEQICTWNNQPPRPVIRVNRTRCEREQLQAALAAQEVQATPHPMAPEELLCLEGAAGIESLPGYAEGWFYVQDPSTLLAPRLLAAQPGEQLWDACAAPGGKTAILAEGLAGEGCVLASDISAGRLQRTRENLERLGMLPQVQLLAHDALSEGPLPGAPFDGILLDVPCSNTGVLRTRPDARWRVTLKGLAEVVELQGRILAAVAGQLRPGGRLVYSTCSIEAEENTGQVQGFLASHPEFQLEEEILLRPGEQQSNGGYAVRLRRRNT